MIIRTEGDWRGEGDVELHFRSGYCPLATRELAGLRVNAVNERVGGREVRAEHRRREGELTGNRAIGGEEVVVGRRIHACVHPVVRGVVRINRKDVIELDLNVVYVGGCGTTNEQAGEGGVGDDGW